MKVAIVYDRVNNWGGVGRVLLALHNIFPDAHLYTSVYDERSGYWAKDFPKIYTSFLQRIPGARGWHQGFGWLMPFIFESFNFDQYDLVISVTSEAAKGIITKPQTKHVCYMFTPTRYLWSQYEFYFKNPILRLISIPVVKYLRYWDKIASQRPDLIVSISNEVKQRVKKYYRRDSAVVYPPMDIKNFKFPFSGHKSKSKYKFSNYYLVVGRLVPYKRIDLAIRTFNKLKKTLVIVGTGSYESKLKSIADNNIKFTGQVSDEDLVKIYRGARALIMSQEDDFGIVSVEAQSFGIPVIAYKKGGAKDTVIDGKTGILFDKQNVESLTSAIEKFEKSEFLVDNLYTNAERFSQSVFEKEFIRTINL